MSDTSKEHLLGDAESSYHDDSSSFNDDHSESRRLSNSSITKSPSFWRYLTIAAYSWAALSTIPAVLYGVQLIAVVSVALSSAVYPSANMSYSTLPLQQQ